LKMLTLFSQYAKATSRRNVGDKYGRTPGDSRLRRGKGKEGYYINYIKY